MFNLLYHCLSLFWFEWSNVGCRRSASYADYSFKLVEDWSAWQQRFLEVDLGDDTAETPDVCLLIVVLGAEQNFGCSIPSGCYAFSKDGSFVVGFLGNRPNQTKITHFCQAIAIKKEIAGLEISMDQLGTMQKFQSHQDLIDYVSLVYVLQQSLTYDIVHICLHVLEQEIHIPIVLGSEHLMETDDIWVV